MGTIRLCDRGILTIHQRIQVECQCPSQVADIFFEGRNTVVQVDETEFDKLYPVSGKATIRQMTVQDLALRGLELEKLLDFFAGLGETYMIDFDPHKST